MKNDKFRVIIADDHPVVRMGLRHIMDKEKSFIIIAEASNREELYSLLADYDCDLVIFDQRMPDDGDGIEILKVIKKRYSEIKTVIMSQYFQRNVVEEAMALGVDGYITKDDISDTIISVLKNIMCGIKAFSPRVQSVFLNMGENGINWLSPREMEILKLIISGMTRREIAAKLGISVPTVDFHLQNIREKLDAKNMAEIIRIAANNGLV